MNAIASRLTTRLPHKLVFPTVLGGFFILWFAFAYTYIPVKSHWHTIFRPAVFELLSGRSPYNIQNFYNPPWTLLPVIPFALFPEKMGSSIYSAITLVGFSIAAYRLGAKPFTILLFIIEPHTLYNAFQLNIDWLVALGFSLPPQIGLFLILSKPQIGVPLALFWLIEAFRRGSWREAIKIFTPVTLTFLLSLVLYGPWILSARRIIPYLTSEVTLWPWSVPLGLMLLLVGFFARKAGPMIIAGPLLSPYVQPYTWPLAILGFLPYQSKAISLIIVLWVIWYFRGWSVPIFFAP